MKTYSLKYRPALALSMLLIGVLACGTFTATTSDGAPQANPGEGVLGPEDGVRTSPPTWTPAPSNTPQPSPTRKPTQEATSTPTLASAIITSLAQTTSVVITAAPIEDDDLSDWQKIETDNAEIWVPGDYQVINFSDGFDEAFAELFSGFSEAFIDAFSELAEEEGGEPIPTLDNSEFEQLFPFDMVVGLDESSFTSMAMIGEPVEGETDLESELNRAVLEQQGPGINLVDRSIVELPNFNAGRLIFEGIDPDNGLPFKQVGYIIVDGDLVWTIIYGTSRDFFDDLFPSTFQKSINTFRVK